MRIAGGRHERKSNIYGSLQRDVTLVLFWLIVSLTRTPGEKDHNIRTRLPNLLHIPLVHFLTMIPTTVILNFLTTIIILFFNPILVA